MVVDKVVPTPPPPGKEDSNQSSMEEGEPDLANMIVIDEVCDPTKQQQQQQHRQQPQSKAAPTGPKAKDKEVKKLSEKDIRQLQRRYTLPETPEIVVHPSRTAKGGKFDCSLMTLSVLLDYGLDDSKEHSFEVYLFAELFNEMLMRDAGYNIYKALYGLPERREVMLEGKKKESKASAAVTSSELSEKREKGGDKKEETNKDDGGGGEGKRSKEVKERKKQITVNPELLLSFAFFDQTQCGYVLCKDLEDLLSSLGMALSKGQIRKVVKKAAVSDSLYYR